MMQREVTGMDPASPTRPVGLGVHLPMGMEITKAIQETEGTQVQWNIL